ncbi:MAG: DNA/RNA nuclease SfsA [Gammaproteobacteria bacterium]|nr:DNA/RNA nuclease SfsA [Gammaproteobacteria bacterium]MDH3466835.1 DNA/RNA nuclease SfsA [Gammaproteobacteria bacterium]
MSLISLGELTAGTIVRRYKRFLADIELADGRVVVAHCPNTGSMESCWAPGKRVELSHRDNPKRKLPWTLERVDMGSGWVGVHTGRANELIAAAVQAQRIPALCGYRQLKREPRINAPGFAPSRFDLALTHGNRSDAFVEVKNTTLLRGRALLFPDAVTERGRKHLDLLLHMVKQKYRAVLVFAINRPEGDYFEPAAAIDPDYAERLEFVAARGVEVIAVRLRHASGGIDIAGSTRYRPR